MRIKEFVVDLNELKCWQGYTRVRGVPAGSPGSCKKSESLDDSDTLDEKWSDRYKRSINCASPKGFSQRAHCQGRKKS